MGKDKFGFGDVVKHKIHGFTGVVIAITHWLHNCDRYTVLPRELKDGQPLDAKAFDEPSLELVAAADEEQVRHESRSTVKLGDIAIDTATDAKGTVFGIYYDANGCTRYFLQPRGLHDGKVVDLISVDDLHVALVETSAAPKAAAPSPPKVTTGGPRQEPSRRSEPTRR